GKEATVSLVLKLVGLITLVSVVNVPFVGVLRAAEQFVVLGAIGIFESLMKLSVAFSLVVFSNDLLVKYTALLLGVSFVTFLVHVIVVWVRYSSFRFNPQFVSWALAKTMTGYTG